MSSDVQLVLTDFDGTVVEFAQHTVSEQVREAVIACEEKGIRMVPVTGRYYDMAKPVLEILGFEDLGIFDNGATIQNCKTGEIVWSKWLEPYALKLVARALRPTAVILDYSEEHIEHAPSENEDEVIDAVDTSASHAYALVERVALPQIEASLRKIPDITWYIAGSTRGHEPHLAGIQVNHKLADKFHGVEALRKIIGVPKENTLAIGDGENDLALFENAGIKVAMGNAGEKLKAAADYVTLPVSQDGFVAAMQKFVL